MKRAINRLSALLMALAMAAAMMSGSTASALTPSYAPSQSYRQSVYYERLCAVELTGDRRTDIANIAQSQVGYHESSSENDLGGTSGSSGNCTEYGYAFGQTQDAWCAMFVWWCAAQAGIPESIVARTEWARVMAFDCPYSEFADASPQVGDLLFIDSDEDGMENHVGLVTAVDEQYITSVEGNCTDKVSVMRYSRRDGTGYGCRILYVGVPEYSQAGTQSRAVTYARITSGKASAYKNASTLSKVMKTVYAGEEYQLINVKNILGTKWYNLEFGLSAYWVKAEHCALFTVRTSGGTTAPAAAVTTAHTATTAASTQTAPAYEDITPPHVEGQALGTVATGQDGAAPDDENIDIGIDNSVQIEYTEPPTSPTNEQSALPAAQREGEQGMRYIALALAAVSIIILLSVIVAIMVKSGKKAV